MASAATGSLDGIGRGLGQVDVAHLEDDCGVGDGVISGAVGAGFVAFAENFSALVEVVLGPGAGGKVGDVIELIPEAIELLLSLVIEDELTSGRSSR